MFGARGLSLGLGGVNLNDLSNLRSANAAHRAQLQLQVQQQKNRYSRIIGVGSTTTNTTGVGPPTAQTSTSSPTTTTPPPTTIIKTGLKNPGKSSMEPKKKTRIVVKKTLDRTTFWSVCRALVFGTLLIALGAAMSTIGYYKEYFATEFLTTGNETITIINYSTRTHFESLSYIGPCIMGCGMFVLMLACVMTLEGRDLNTQIYSQRLSRKTSSTRRSTRSRTETDDDGKLVEQTGPNDEQKPLQDDNNKHDNGGQNGSNNNNIDNNNKYDGTHSTGDTAGGKINECFTKDDSKFIKQTQLESDLSGPYSTTTTTLTWSRSGGPRCESVPQETSATVCESGVGGGSKRLSASSIDALTKKANARALLQRFLEDQSRLVDDRMQQMRLRKLLGNEKKKGGGGVELKKQSASLDVAGSEKLVDDVQRYVRSEDYSSRLKHNVVAEVHHSGDAQSPLTTHQWQGAGQTTPYYDARVYGFKTYHAPIASAEPSEIFCSPMSFSPDLPSTFVTPAGRGNNNGRPTPNGYLSAKYSPSPVRSRQNSVLGSQLSVNSYKTVKSHISATSVGGLSSNEWSRPPGSTDQRANSSGSFDFINGNRLGSQSDFYSYNQPYFTKPTSSQLYVMNSIYQPNSSDSTIRRTSDSVVASSSGHVETEEDRLSSLSIDPVVNSTNSQSKKRVSSYSRSNVPVTKTLSNV